MRKRKRFKREVKGERDEKTKCTAYPETFTVYPNFQIKIFTLKSSL